MRDPPWSLMSFFVAIIALLVMTLLIHGNADFGNRQGVLLRQHIPPPVAEAALVVCDADTTTHDGNYRIDFYPVAGQTSYALHTNRGCMVPINSGNNHGNLFVVRLGGPIMDVHHPLLCFNGWGNTVVA